MLEYISYKAVLMDFMKLLILFSLFAHILERLTERG